MSRLSRPTEYSKCRALQRLAPWYAIAALGSFGCSQRYWVCDEVSEAQLARLPDRLSQTGLYHDLAADALADAVLPYRPRFELWSDGASKRRWLMLPNGTQIDSRDMDNWIFPEGTKLWKEFTRDGVRVETRLLQKIGPSDDDWVGVAYLWAEDQHDAYAAAYGAVDAQGTKHDVPAASECPACHGGTKSRVLGVSALQLGDEHASLLTLQALVERGLLSTLPSELVYDLPGDATQQAALGYLHANCGSCHNGERPAADGARCFDPDNALDFKLSLDELGDVKHTATYRTMRSAVKAGKPSESRMVETMAKRGFFGQMPPLATDEVDREALAVVRRWIDEL
jgi:hypothetical protein